jgi:hypothetical protein
VKTSAAWSVCIYGFLNKQPLFPYIALTDWFVQPRRSVFTARYGLTVYYLIFSSCGLNYASHISFISYLSSLQWNSFRNVWLHISVTACYNIPNHFQLPVTIATGYRLCSSTQAPIPWKMEKFLAVKRLFYEVGRSLSRARMRGSALVLPHTALQLAQGQFSLLSALNLQHESSLSDVKPQFSVSTPPAPNSSQHPRVCH